MKIIIIFLTIILMTMNVSASENYQTAIFAGGCFWCMESAFEGLAGVINVISGYAGAGQENPSYENVSTGATGYKEAIKITFDPARASYAEILDVFWKSIDPTDTQGQFADKGSQYQAAIFYENESQKTLAEQSKKALEDSKIFSRPIVTQILKAQSFYPAEEYHQDYYKKNADHYNFYKKASGREGFLKKTWKDKENVRICPLPPRKLKKPYLKPSDEELRKKLTDLQYNVTQECGTEKPFANQYWDNKEEGIYVDAVSGEPLFASIDKFDSNSGWPSFTKPLEASNIVEKNDMSLGMARTEVKSKNADSHLGHVFDDGPGPTGKRFCINSAALRFIPKKDLEKEGYGQYLKIFDK